MRHGFPGTSPVLRDALSVLLALLAYDGLKALWAKFR